MTRPDPIIDEIHRLREEHAAKFNYDAAQIVEDIQKEAKRVAPNMKRVTLSPRRLTKATH